MELGNPFGRKVLEAYLAVAVLILTVIVYILLAGVGFNQESGLGVLSILLIILTGVNILHAIIELRILDELKT